MQKQTKQKSTKRRSVVRDEPAPRRDRVVGRAAGSRASAESDAVRNRKSVSQGSANNPSAHVLVRVRAEDGLTIQAHERMVARHGVAMFGKFGQPLGPEFRDFLNRQTASGQKTYLFITTRDGWGHEYITYRCPLRQVLDTLDGSNRHLVPGYYIAQAPYIRTWFEIEGIERLSRDEMNRIFVLSSGRSITSAIFSKTGLFRVGIRDTSRAA